MGETKLVCNISKEEPAYIVTVPREKCKFKHAMALGEGEDTCICCIYGYDNNIYVCKYCGEEIRVNGGEETGKGSMYCNK